MAADRIPFYSHRQNRDGSFDSICPRCFATIAHATEITKLNSYEKQHICDESFLAERGALSGFYSPAEPFKSIQRRIPTTS
jgi:hypothetical protein